MSNKSIMLAPFTSDDSSILMGWINNRDQVLFNSPYKPVHQEQHKAWFESVQKRNDLFIFGIRQIQTHELIGSCQLHSIDNISRSAELQIRLGVVAERGKGFGTQAVHLLLDFGFYDLNLHRIYLHVFSNNIPAIRTYEKTGFVREGLLREAVYLDGNYVDIVIMGILKSEYIKL